MASGGHDYTEEGGGHLERQSEKLKEPKEDFRGRQEQQDEGVAMRVEMKESQIREAEVTHS